MRLVDADKLKISYDGHFVGVAKNDLDNAPTVEAKPVKHGHWIKGGYTFIGVHKVDEYICSLCGYHTLEAGNYCGNCSAVMDGEVNSDA